MNERLQQIIGKYLLEVSANRPVMTLTSADIPVLMRRVYDVAYQAGMDAGFKDGMECAQDMAARYEKECN